MKERINIAFMLIMGCVLIHSNIWFLTPGAFAEKEEEQAVYVGCGELQ